MNTVLSNITVSVTELKRDFASILKQADGSPIAYHNHNRPEAYLLPAAHYERLMAYIEDMEDAALVYERGNGPFVEVDLDEL
ncbi:MAG: type II toxin-antitoxin system Phd/YefM family antitoxin [Deltaproteobacteria bacterium]|jgi:antitoxin StbD